jgi:hypothetical protein
MAVHVRLETASNDGVAGPSDTMADTGEPAVQLDYSIKEDGLLSARLSARVANANNHSIQVRPLTAVFAPPQPLCLYTFTLSSASRPSVPKGTLVLDVPWQLQLLYHTLRVESPDGTLTTHLAVEPARPSLDQPAHITMPLRVPARSLLRVHVEGHKAFPHADAFDHEPFRGIHIPPARFLVACSDLAGAHAAAVDPACALLQSSQLTSSALRLRLAVPDMSMPFNVMMIAGTLWSMIFSALLGLAIGRLQKMPPLAEKQH